MAASIFRHFPQARVHDSRNRPLRALGHFVEEGFGAAIVCFRGRGGVNSVWAAPWQAGRRWDWPLGSQQVQQGWQTVLLWAVAGVGATNMPLSSLPLQGEPPTTVRASAHSRETLTRGLAGARVVRHPGGPHRHRTPRGPPAHLLPSRRLTDTLYLRPSSLCW